MVYSKVLVKSHSKVQEEDAARYEAVRKGSTNQVSWKLPGLFLVPFLCLMCLTSHWNWSCFDWCGIYMTEKTY